jgi:hypothetical protein
MELDERDHETFEDGGQAADAAMYKLMKTPPTTLAGMRAIIHYLVDWDNDSGYCYLPTPGKSPISPRLITEALFSGAILINLESLTLTLVRVRLASIGRLRRSRLFASRAVVVHLESCALNIWSIGRLARLV